MDFDQIMESEVDIKPKKESKEELLGIKEEKIDHALTFGMPKKVFS